MVIMEWIQYTFTPLASWGVAAYTMHDNVSLIQAVSLFGLAGLSFLIYWVNVSIATIIIKRKTTISTFQLPVNYAVPFNYFWLHPIRHEQSQWY